MLDAQALELAAEVGLRIDVAHVLHLQLRAAGQHRRIAEVGQAGRDAAGLQGRRRQTHGGGTLVAVVVADAHLGVQLHRRREAVHMTEADGGGFALVAVAGHAVVGARIDRQQRGRADGGRRGRADPRQAVVHAVVVVQMVEGQRELVLLADAGAVGAGQAGLVDRRARAVVVGLGVHHAQTQRRAVARADVEVADHPQVAVAADGHIDLVLVDQTRGLGDLVDRAAGRATAEHHRRRAAQHLDAVMEEGVAVIEGRIAHAVDEDIAGRLQREAAQADVLLAAFGRQEADAGGVLQHVLHRVEVAVIHQLLGDHGDRLRHVAQFLPALADGGGGGLQAVLAALLVLLGLDGDLAQRRDLGGSRLGGGGRRLLGQHLRRQAGQAEAGGQRAQRQRLGQRRTGCGSCWRSSGAGTTASHVGILMQ